MKTDFLDAHNRHWEDGLSLFQSQRWANADHLFGIAAECGLKHLMLVFGMPYDSGKNRPLKKEDLAHINKIWDRFESYRSGHAQGASYILPVANLFNNWDVSQRYAPRSEFNQVYTEQHRQGATAVRKLLRQAQLEGLI